VAPQHADARHLLGSSTSVGRSDTAVEFIRQRISVILV